MKTHESGVTLQQLKELNLRLFDNFGTDDMNSDICDENHLKIKWSGYCYDNECYSCLFNTPESVQKLITEMEAK